MTWSEEHGLARRIGTASIPFITTASVPLILCGPILRRVESHAVSVFVALKYARQVTLTIHEGPTKAGQAKFEGQVQTVPLGKYLHVAVVTAALPLPVADPDALLSPGQLYGYNLTFTRVGEPVSIDDFPVRELANFDFLQTRYGWYEEGTLPTFSLPPQDLNRLRIIHGSCRKPHGESLDALPALDAMIATTWRDPLRRPHQLFLTGDQIYADDVADMLLAMVTDAGNTLLGWEELAVTGNTVVPKGLSGVSIPLQAVQPGHRSPTARRHCGLTVQPPPEDSEYSDEPGADKSHLLSLGEYCAMYLFAWSDTLWPDELGLPKFEDIYPDAPRRVGERVDRFGDEREAILAFQKTLPGIRRALMSVPTYMIFDDHEITDDWNLNRAWCERVLARPFGRRVIQNGLTAFAIFQAWGNTPEQFRPSKPGHALLEAAVAWSASQGTDATARANLNALVSIPDNVLASITNDRPLTHQPGALDWHYYVTGPRHEVLVLDTRTWRAYPGAAIDFPVLMSNEGFQRQFPPRSPNAEVTIVVSPVPVVGVPFIEEHQQSAMTQAERLASDTEAWGLQPFAYESLLSCLAQRLPQVTAGGKRKGYVVFLSGDVHYGYAARLQYWATHSFNAMQPIEAELIVAQLTSSALKNETRRTVKLSKQTHQLHTKGFLPLDVNRLPIRPRVVGWNNPGGDRRVVGTRKLAAGVHTEFVDWPIHGHPGLVHLHEEQLTWNVFSDPQQPPHWRYRIDFILAENEVREPAPFAPRPVPAPPPGDRKQALASYLAASANHTDVAHKWGDGKEIVGVNNIGEITFRWQPDDAKAVVQELWWRLQQRQVSTRLLTPFPLSKAIVSLNFNDSKYPQPSVQERRAHADE